MEPQRSRRKFRITPFAWLIIALCLVLALGVYLLCCGLLLPRTGNQYLI